MGTDRDVSEPEPEPEPQPQPQPEPEELEEDTESRGSFSNASVHCGRVKPDAGAQSLKRRFNFDHPSG